MADVAWASNQLVELIRDETECSVATKICIEVMSAANTEEEILEKRKLYCENGAEEFWICNQQSEFTFFSPAEELPYSFLVPTFPKKL